MMTEYALATLATGPIRSGPRAIEQLPHAVREQGVGRAIVVHDETAAAVGGLQWTQNALHEARLRAVTPPALPPEGGDDGDWAVLLDELHSLDGGLVITVGQAPTVETGKALAAAVNNETLTALAGGALTRSPRPHVAVPCGVWPPSEATDTLEIDPAGTPHPAGVIRDSQLTPLAIIDERLHTEHDPQVRQTAEANALAVTACAATDPTRTLDEKTRALAAAHGLAHSTDAGTRHHPAARTAISLAGASHRDYTLCHRCRAGQHRVDEELTNPTTPSEACLRQALHFAPH